MMNTLRGDYINGDFRPPSKATWVEEVRDPGNLDNVVAIAQGQDGHVEEAVSAARHSRAAWAAMVPKDRRAIINRWRGAIRQRWEELAIAVLQETGKTLRECQGEVRALLFRFDIMLSEASPLISGYFPEGLKGGTRFKPRGTGAIFPPPVTPAHGMTNPAVALLMAGNSTVIAVPWRTPTTGRILAESAHEAGFPPGVLNFVLCDRDGREALALHPEVELVHLVDTWDRGKELVRASLDYPDKLVVLETAGQNTALVLDDAHHRRTLHEIFAGAFLSAGQRCVSTRRVVMVKGAASRFLSSLQAMVRNVTVGYGTDEEAFMGPLISAGALRTMEQASSVAGREESHVEVLVPMKRPAVGHAGHYVTPSVHLVHRPDKKSRYQNVPRLVPDLAIYIARDCEEAVQIANSSDYRLTASVFGQKRDQVVHACNTLRFGMTNINRSTASISARLPYEGQGKSGSKHPEGLFAPYFCTSPVSRLEEWGPLTMAETLPAVPFPQEED